MRIGIITLVKVNNYGAELQAFATQHVLQEKGYDAEIIDYLYFTNPRHKKTKGSKPSFKMPLKVRLVAMFYPWLRRYKRLKQKRDYLKRREKRFADFHLKNTKFSAEYRTIESLKSSALDYDAYIVGSDQVWNPNNYTSLDPYFLLFAPHGKKKISFASSFGVSKLPVHTLDYYRAALLNLDAISVREEDAVQMVEMVSGKKAQWVLDPTLLMTREEWNKYSESVPGLPDCFVLIYEVTPCAYVKLLALNVAEELGCHVVRINCDASRQEEDEDVINIMDAGPGEFVWLFNKARVVVTNSFHGTAFSLIMKKDFFVVAPSRKKNNSRQMSLLRLVGLENHLLIEGATIPKLSDYEINYNDVEPLINVARNKSFKYLEFVLNGE